MTVENRQDSRHHDALPPFHELLLRYRTLAGESHEDLATVLGITAKAVKTYERPPEHLSSRTPPAAVFRRLSAHYQATGILPRDDAAGFAAAWTRRRRNRHAHARKAAKAAPFLPIASPGDGAPRFRQPLPRRLTPLVGRESLVDSLGRLVQEPTGSLVTLVGVGGVGKTRVALDVARCLQSTFSDGVFFIELASVTAPEAVATTIAEHVGVREPRAWDPRDRLLAWLSDKHALLVLDSFEHVLAAAPLVSDLLARGEGVKILITSRSPLHLYGEQLREIPPLAPPAAQELFLQRVRDVQADFAETAENTAVIAAICKRLAGLPLAIELAAWRMKWYGTAQALLTALKPSLPELVEGPRDVPSRQQTMRATIAWSYDLLASDARWLFRQLSVCQGGCTMSAVRALGEQRDGVATWLKSLIEHGMIQRGSQTDIDGEIRFWMFDVLTEYGLEQLSATGEKAAARRRHAQHYLLFAEMAEPQLTGPQQEVWLGRLEREHDNLRAALQWSLESGETTIGLCMAGALWRFWRMRGHLSEGRTWLERFLTKSSSDKTAEAMSMRAKALRGAGILAVNQGDYEGAVACHEESLRLYRDLGDQWGIAAVLNNLGSVAREQGNYWRATALYEESLALYRALASTGDIAILLNNLGEVAREQSDYERATALYVESLALVRELGDTWSIAATLGNLGLVAREQGDLERAAALHEESLALHRELGDKRDIASTLNNLGEVARDRGDYARATALYAESLALYREMGHKRGMAILLTNLGLVARAQDDYGRAARLYVEALRLLGTEGDKVVIALCLEGLAAVACAQGRPEHAVRLCAAADALREGIGAPLAPAERPMYDRLVTRMRTVLGDEAFATFWAAGRCLLLPQAIVEALSGDA